MYIYIHEYVHITLRVNVSMPNVPRTSKILRKQTHTSCPPMPTCYARVALRGSLHMCTHKIKRIRSP